MISMRILVVEDNQRLAGYIKKALEQKSYSVDVAYDGVSGEEKASFGEYDLIILDVMLPGKDGITVCKDMRTQNIVTPVIMLTAKGDLDYRIEGLDSGADDYLVKPFELAELLARIRALLRRPQQKTAEILTAQDLSLDVAKMIIQKNAKPLSLTLKEYAVLEYLMRNKDRVVTREQILDHCWDHSFDSFSNIVDVYIKQLRKKLSDTDDTYVKTVRGIGYILHG